MSVRDKLKRQLVIYFINLIISMVYIKILLNQYADGCTL